MNRKKTVLIVDDSPIMRGLLANIIATDPDFDVVGTAQDPIDARDKIKHLHPDIMTLDVEMPLMNGIEFLRLVMRLRPMPVVMISSLTQQGADKALQAIELGAFDAIGKPDLATPNALEEFANHVLHALRAAGMSRFPEPQTGPPPTLAKLRSSGSVKLIAIGSSTGGVEAIRHLLGELPSGLPPIVITQHMPASFLTSFAERLNKLSSLHVRLAEGGMTLRPGTVTIAPGIAHLEIRKQGDDFVCKLMTGEKVSGHVPSVDVMFRSVAEQVGKDALGVLLTGMGSDGAQGMLAMRNSGAMTIGQSEASCVIYGMPRRAMELGAVQQELALNDISRFMITATQGVHV